MDLNHKEIFPLHINYGGILQAYALKTVMERMGHEVWVINEPYHREKLPLKKYWLTYLKRLVKILLFRKNVHLFLEDYTLQKTKFSSNMF